MYSCPAAVRGSCTRPTELYIFSCGDGPVLRDIGGCECSECQNPTRTHSNEKDRFPRLCECPPGVGRRVRRHLRRHQHERLSGPGSLRQAILDSNAGGVADVISFNIPEPGPFVITVFTPLPAFTGTVHLDATTQPGYEAQPFIGTGGTVGVDGLALPQIRLPIVQVFGNGLVENGLVFDGSNNSTLAGLHVWGFTGTNVDFSNSTDATVFRNLIGADPAFGDPGSGLQAAINLLVDGNNPNVRENLVAYSSTLDNVLITTQRGDILVEGNELVGTLRNSASPILVRGAELPNRYIGRNLIRNSLGYGLDIVGGIEQMTISNNTVRNNGTGGVNPAGIRLTSAGPNSSRNNVLDHNIVTGNLGPGILITGNTLSSNRGNTITRNSIYGNGGIGIDLGGPSSDPLIGDGRTLNDPGDVDEAATFCSTTPSSRAPPSAVLR